MCISGTMFLIITECLEHTRYIDKCVKLKNNVWFLLDGEALGSLKYWKTAFELHKCYNVCSGSAVRLLFSRYNRCFSQQAMQYLSINEGHPHSVKLYKLQYF